MPSPVCVSCGHNQMGQDFRVLDLGCDRSHDEVVKACEQCAWRMLREQPNLPCPLCEREGLTSLAGVAVYCGFCRKGVHTSCRAMRAGTRVFAGLDPWNSEGYCACTCDLDDPMLPGAGYARHPSPEKLDAFEAELREAFAAHPQMWAGPRADTDGMQP